MVIEFLLTFLLLVLGVFAQMTDGLFSVVTWFLIIIITYQIQKWGDSMGQCTMCGKKGLFFKVDKNSRCADCAARVVALEAKRAAQMKEQENTLDIASLEVIGSVFNTYVITTDGECVYLIDQHAAHERVFYEKLLAQYHSSDKLQQEMLIPLQISVSADVESAEDSWIGYLRDMGYDIENFGSRMYIVRAVPAFAGPEETERFLRQMLLELEQGPSVHSFAGLDRLIMRSCKSAIKGGDAMHPQELRSLLTQLAACERPWSCPHGRPTIVKLTRYDLERMFKR